MLRTLILVAVLAIAHVVHAQDPTQTDGDKYAVRFENDRVRVLEYRDRPGEKTSLHRHPAFVLYAVAPFKRTITLPDGKVLTHANSKLVTCFGRMSRSTLARM
jgi:hypothetical protein